ncbi:MAG: HAD-IA family hydrolase [Actinomycetota bacterium]|nr:HAD-IA family hydrolase [Actinomycetota bacterium]
MTAGVTAVLFDAGETLVYPHPSFAELFTEILRGEGRAVDPAVVIDVMAEYSSRLTPRVDSEEPPEPWSTSPERSRTFWFGIYDSFLGRVGIHEDHQRLSERLYEAFSDPANYRLHGDAVPVLERLEAAGTPMGLVSNFEEWLELLLEGLDVARYFPVRVISGVVGVEKPDPRIFAMALQRLGVRAEESAYVGDHPYFDVAAARRAGMVPVLIDRGGRHPDVDAIRITSLEELPDALGLDA